MYSLLLSVLSRLGVGLSESKLSEMLETSTLSESSKVLLRDQIVDLQTLLRKVYVGINPSIREAIRQQGLGIIENTYCGFDTEYKNIDMGENHILSAQWAVNSQIILTLPRLTEYELSSQNTESGESYPINPM